MYSKIKNFIKKRWAYFLSLTFIWLIPIIMLNEIVSLVEVNIVFKITFLGCVVLLIIFFAVKKKMYAWIERKPHGVIRGVLLCLHKILTYLLVLGIMWSIHAFTSKFLDWWLLCGISWLIGFAFLIIDENLNKEKKNETENNKL